MLAVHERTHQGEKGHECTVCGREFSRAFSLKQHMKMHAGENEFMCHLCGCTFEKVEDLTAHASSHAYEREFVCDQCGKTFVFKVTYSLLALSYVFIIVLVLALHNQGAMTSSVHLLHFKNMLYFFFVAL